ncbi:MAG: hypothetical protein ACYTHM_06505 [Planctomycetota bacterium]|jgi:hypothetical protein
MIRMGIGFVVLALWMAYPAGIYAETVMVTVKGTGETEEEALADALRKAVEKGSGIEVTSRTETLDHAVAFDRIVTRAKGFVAKHTTQKKEKKWGLWQITIEAEVDKGKIKGKWGEIQLILEQKGRPTIMVLIKETVFDKAGKAQEAMTSYAASAIESLLIKKNFTLKSARGLQEIEKRNRDAAVANNDLDALAAIARKHGANVMIVGDSTCRYSGAGKAHGVDLVHYQATASIAAYSSETADLILRTTVEGQGAGLGEAKAISLAFKRTAEKVSDDVLKKLLNRWYFEFQHGANIALKVTILAKDAETLRQCGKMAIRFQEVLKGIPGVKNAEMEYSKETEKAIADYTVEAKLNVESLRNKILALDTKELGFELEWTGSGKNSLRFNLHMK